MACDPEHQWPVTGSNKTSGKTQKVHSLNLLSQNWCGIFGRRMLALWPLVCACVAPFSAVRAENGRDFAGEYTLSGIVESNGTVSATLTVRIANYSGHDIQGARLLLAGSGTAIADNIGFANHARQVIRTPVTIPSREFARWRNGPVLAVEWRDIDGSLARRPVELHRAPVMPEVS